MCKHGWDWKKHETCPACEDEEQEKRKGVFQAVDVGCCGGNVEGCVCGHNERVLRSYVDHRRTVPMTAEQREWCIEEADKCGEGMYSREQLEGYNDHDLAWTVIDAWHAYCQSQGLI